MDTLREAAGGTKKGPTLRPQLRFGNPYNEETGEAHEALLAEATANSKRHVRVAKESKQDAKKELEEAEKDQIAAEADAREAVDAAEREEAELRALDASAELELAHSKISDARKIAELVVAAAELSAEKAEKRHAKAVKAANLALKAARKEVAPSITMWSEVEQPPAKLMKAAVRIAKMARDKAAEAAETAEEDAPATDAAADGAASQQPQKRAHDEDRIDAAAQRIADAEKGIEDAQQVAEEAEPIAKAQVQGEKAAAAKAAAIRKARAEEALRHAKIDAEEAARAEQEAIAQQLAAEAAALKAAEEAKNSPAGKAAAAKKAEEDAQAAAEAAEVARSLAGAARARHKDAAAAAAVERKDELKRAKEEAEAVELAAGKKAEAEKAEEAKLAERLQAQAKRVAEAKAKAAAEAAEALATPAKTEETKAEAKGSMVVATAIALAAQSTAEEAVKPAMTPTPEPATDSSGAKPADAATSQATKSSKDENSDSAVAKVDSTAALPDVSEAPNASKEAIELNDEAIEQATPQHESAAVVDAEGQNKAEAEGDLSATQIVPKLAEDMRHEQPSPEQPVTKKKLPTTESALSAAGKVLIETAKPRDKATEQAAATAKREAAAKLEDVSAGPLPEWLAVWEQGAQRCSEMSCALSVTSDCLVADATGDALICVGGDGDAHSVSLYSMHQQARLGEAEPETPICLHGHTDKVVSVACDGDVIASGSKDKTIRLWSAATGECACTLVGCQGTVHGLSLRGDLLLSGEGGLYKDGGVRVRLWSMSSMEMSAVYDEHRAVVWSVVLGEEIGVSASHDKTARVWRLDGSDASALACMKHPNWVSSVSLDRDLAATGCADTRVRLWSLRSYRCLRVFTHGVVSSGVSPVFSVRLAEGGCALLTGGQDQNVKLWAIPRTRTAEADAEPGAGEPVCVLTLAHGEMVRGLVMLPLDGRIVTAGGRSTSGLIVWRPAQEAATDAPPASAQIASTTIESASDGAEQADGEFKRGVARRASKEKEKKGAPTRRRSSSPAQKPGSGSGTPRSNEKKKGTSPRRRSFLG